MTLEHLRKHYTLGVIHRGDLKDCPIEQFRLWFDELHRLELPSWFESNAMVLSTATSAGKVSSRVVLLKAITDQGFTFFSNYQSYKAKQLAENSRGALNFYWPMMERQVRIEGEVTQVSAAISDDYFQARPFRSRLGAILSPQSQIIADDETLEKKLEVLEQQYADEKVPRPEYWGGYQLIPDRIEFWQGKPSRLHDRFEYRRGAGSWTVSRLAP